MVKNLITVEQILKITSVIRVIGSKRIEIKKHAPIKGADKNCLSFCNIDGPKGKDMISASNAGIILCYDSVANSFFDIKDQCIITTENPRLAFARCIDHFFNPEPIWEIHPTAFIEKSAKISGKISIGPYAYIGENVSLGSNTIIEGRVHIKNNVKIGNNCLIQTGSVIGCTGQGFERNKKNEFEKLPQLGTVLLEDYVEIGSNSTIVRGSMTETKIGKGTKIGNLVNIGHNVQIDNHVFISAGVIVCGSAKIGNYSWISPNSCIRDYIQIGENVKVGLGAVVVKDVTGGQTVIGNPAKPI